MALVSEIDGIAMSALCAQGDDLRAVVVAVHGGATTSRYFDCPERPWLSLLRIGTVLGFTVLAVDRPGYGESAGPALPGERSAAEAATIGRRGQLAERMCRGGPQQPRGLPSLPEAEDSGADLIAAAEPLYGPFRDQLVEQPVGRCLG
ncbi:alpha/beta fold hydrolase [Nocardia pseudovaccinii]|uniref:alpha/beta fold hydrolase n=1 Tax=Nocardia pseudovaccinii TaxID=189540 RepID=UPI0007A5246F